MARTSLEEATEPTVVQLCLQGFEHGIHIAALFEMPPTARLAASEAGCFIF